MRPDQALDFDAMLFGTMNRLVVQRLWECGEAIVNITTKKSQGNAKIVAQAAIP